MKDDFWGEGPAGGGHRKPGSPLRALLRVPQGLSAPVWYIALGLGALVLCVALGGLVGAVLGLTNAWFR